MESKNFIINSLKGDEKIWKIGFLYPVVILTLILGFYITANSLLEIGFTYFTASIELVRKTQIILSAIFFVIFYSSLFFLVISWHAAFGKKIEDKSLNFIVTFSLTAFLFYLVFDFSMKLIGTIEMLYHFKVF